MRTRATGRGRGRQPAPGGGPCRPGSCGPPPVPPARTATSRSEASGCSRGAQHHEQLQRVGDHEPAAPLRQGEAHAVVDREGQPGEGADRRQHQAGASGQVRQVQRPRPALSRNSTAPTASGTLVRSSHRRRRASSLSSNPALLLLDRPLPLGRPQPGGRGGPQGPPPRGDGTLARCPLRRRTSVPLRRRTSPRPCCAGPRAAPRRCCRGCGWRGPTCTTTRCSPTGTARRRTPTAGMREAGVDVAAVTDHAASGRLVVHLAREDRSPRRPARRAWTTRTGCGLAAAADAADEPGTFVALRGFEWSSPRPRARERLGLGRLGGPGVQRRHPPAAPGPTGDTPEGATMAGFHAWLRRETDAPFGLNHPRPGAGPLRAGSRTTRR